MKQKLVMSFASLTNPALFTLYLFCLHLSEWIPSKQGSMSFKDDSLSLPSPNPAFVWLAQLGNGHRKITEKLQIWKGSKQKHPKNEYQYERSIKTWQWTTTGATKSNDVS